MPILLIIALVLGLGAVGVSFVATKPAFTKQIATLEEVETDLASNKRLLNEREGEALAAADALKEVEARNRETSTSIDTTKTAIDTLQVGKRGLEADLTRLTESKAAMDQTLADLRTTLEEVLKEPVTEITPDQIASRIAQLDDIVQEKRGELEQIETRLQSVENQIASRSERLEGLQEQQQRDRQQYAANSWSGEVTQVDNEWGFVVFSGGRARGLSPQAQYIVTRGGQPVAQLEVVNMENSRTVANIKQNENRPAQQVQPGDAVILAEPIGSKR